MNPEHDMHEQDTALILDPDLRFLSIFWRASHALEQTSRAMELRLGITAQQRTLLRIVQRYPGLTAGALARLLHVSSGTVSISLQRLEKRGLLVRGASDRDRRRVSIGLTAAGHAVCKPAGGTVERAVKRLLAGLREGDEQAAARCLAGLADELERERSNER